MPRRSWTRLALRMVVACAALATVLSSAHAVSTPSPDGTPVPGMTERWGEKHLFRVRYASTPSPVPLLAVHEWTLTIADAAERPVRDAKITVLGGMPAHGHGLPTTPVVSELGDGRYRVEGLKFHMPGAWVVAFRIQASAGTDAVSFALELP